MTDHAKFQNRLKIEVQYAIQKVGRIDGTNDISVTNTDVVEALLEIAGFYASMHGFGTYSPNDLARKHAMTLNRHIERFRAMRARGELPIKFVPRSEVN
jgi:hypothetical protein